MVEEVASPKSQLYETAPLEELLNEVANPTQLLAAENPATGLAKTETVFTTESLQPKEEVETSFTL